MPKRIRSPWSKTVPWHVEHEGVNLNLPHEVSPEVIVSAQ